MYLARVKQKGRTRYFIRESRLEGEIYVSRDLMDLGEDPRRFSHYPGRCAFYIDPSVEDALEAVGASPEPDALETVFWPFIDAEMKRKFGYARTRAGSSPKPEGSPPAFHPFDRRRLHFLRFGQMDMRDLSRTSPKLFGILAEKSRDEIEQHLMAEEMRLSPQELKSYVFAVFDLQRHFNKSFAREMPQALEEHQVDTHFLDDVCRLHDDMEFWAGLPREPRLHDYLTRYVIMFFDTDYARSRYLDEILRNRMAGMAGRGDFRFARRRREEATREGSTLFGVSEAQLRKMSKAELGKLYRKKARELHPDAGGAQEDFVKLTEIYESLKSGR